MYDNKIVNIVMVIVMAVIIVRAIAVIVTLFQMSEAYKRGRIKTHTI